LRVLLVDDEQELVEALVERLKFRGIEADFATTKETALKLIQEKKYDVAVLDMKMPKISGLEIMEELKKIQPKLKIGFLTGHGSKEDLKECSLKGGCFYLVKPVDFEDFFNKLKELEEK